MGILKLLPFLKEQGLLKQFDKRRWPVACKAAIDVPIFAYKFIYTERTYEALEQRFLSFGLDLRSQGCEPIFVFDGAKLKLKDAERLRRAAARKRSQELCAIKRSEAIEALQNTMCIDIVSEVQQQGSTVIVDQYFEGLMVPTAADYEKLFNFLQVQGFEVARAKYEAEALCAYLVISEKAWCAITEDTDAIAFGCPRTIFKFSTEEPLLADLDEILCGLKFTRAQFIDLCCMFGTDFCENVYKIGPKNAHALMQKHGSWPLIYGAMQATWQPQTKQSADEFQTTYSEAFQCFETTCYESIL